MLNSDKISCFIKADSSETLSLPSRGEGIAGKLMMLIVAILMCIGIVIVYSSGAEWAKKQYSSSEYFLWRQLAFSALGIITVILVARLDYHIFCKASKIILLVSIILLALLQIGRASCRERVSSPV